jgi:carboxyl-terminal processing protease
MQKLNRLFLIFLIFIALIYIGNMLKDQFFTDTTQSNRAENVRKIEDVMEYVSRYYVDDVNWDEVTEKTLEYFLSQLDPHSVYISTEDVVINEENFEGKYQGIGIYYDVIEDYLTVISPIPDSPSDRVGLMAGDKIVEINGESAIGITNADVQKKLKGPKGTSVLLNVIRQGIDEPLEFTVVRDEIPIYTVTTYFITEDSTGYISLNRFAKTTEKEVEDALENMENLGMKRLILDLRSNGGGYLDQAVMIASKFISGHKKIVFTRGRISRFNNDYYSDNFTSEKVRNYPLIVLIDYGSASASEIVAGAIQDYDRGLIVGETSFGKGLVQNEFPLPDDSRLRLTISKYYTPSGRLIQRPYKGKEIEEYYRGAFEVNESDSSEVLADSISKLVYYTKAGREVHGGGGIRPDSIIPYQTLATSQKLLQKLFTRRIFFELGSSYAKKNANRWESFKDFLNNFEVSNSMLREFRELVARREVEMTDKEFMENKEFFKHRLKAEVARGIWGLDYFYRVLLEKDNQFQSARTLFPWAKKITNPMQIQTLND